MKANLDKCHFITDESKVLVINVENNQLTNSKCEKLLIAGQKLNALSRVIPYIMNITKQRSLLNTFFMSQFNYCPLTWTCKK